MKASTFLILAAALYGAYRFGFSTQKPPPADWGASYTHVLKQAQAENKPILLDFTGSDWCSWCMKMQQEVMGTPQFATYAQKNLVLVTVDFPKSAMLTPGGNPQNESLRRHYKAEGFPTFVLVDKDGRELGRQDGYLPGGPAAFIAKLNTFYTPDPAMVTYHSTDFNAANKPSPSPKPTTSLRRGRNHARS